jgi:hypothetical protein
MAEALHLLTRADDALAAEMIARQKAAGVEVAAVDMTGEPDYADVVNKIFQAGCVHTW